MPEIFVQCVECKADLEIHEVAVKWDDFYIQITPCECQKEK